MLKRCRICGTGDLRVYLDLGSTPLANSYLQESQLQKPEFKEELAIQLCKRCGLSQLTEVVPPDKMYKNYLYVSSTPKTFRDHCAELAETAISTGSLAPGSLVVDIASNDGCLLARFKERGMKVIGVEPAENLAPEANRQGIPTLCAYWSRPLAQDIVKKHGHAEVVTSTNVLAHVDDVHAFASAVKEVLSPKGMWVVEVPYLCDFITKNEFDTAYHEHLSYFSIHALTPLMERHGFKIFDVQYFPRLHGGTIRVCSARPGTHPIHSRVAHFLRKERAFGVKKWSVYESFAKRVAANKKRLNALLARLKEEGRTIWAYGASAKGNTLLNYFGISSDVVPVAIDDNPKKWGFYTPGSHLRIAGIQELAKSHVDELLLLAWNFQDEIMSRCQVVGYQGGFISPVPKARRLPGVKKEILI
jgi:hypothetical protein